MLESCNTDLLLLIKKYCLYSLFNMKLSCSWHDKKKIISAMYHTDLLSNQTLQCFLFIAYNMFILIWDFFFEMFSIKWTYNFEKIPILSTSILFYIIQHYSIQCTCKGFNMFPIQCTQTCNFEMFPTQPFYTYIRGRDDSISDRGRDLRGLSIQVLLRGRPRGV